MSDLAAAMVPGWYGKLPSLGDFASRRLEPAFIEPWDLWLADGLAAQREQLGEAWLDGYLASPTWRFVLMPACLPAPAPQQAIAGVLMPSVDRVGRYFPLTLASPLAQLPRSSQELEGLLGWLHRLEDVAQDALQDDLTIDELEQALAQLPPAHEPPAAAAPPLDALQAALAQALAGDGAFVPIDGLRSRAEMAQALVRALGGAGDGAGGRGRAFWLADHPEQPRLLVSRGLPAQAEFAQMFGATGREPGAATLF